PKKAAVGSPAKSCGSENHVQRQLRIQRYLYSDGKFSERGDPRQQQLFTSESAIQKPALTPVFFDKNWLTCGPRRRTGPLRQPLHGPTIGRVRKSHGTMHHLATWQPKRFPRSKQRRTRRKNAGRDQHGFGRWSHRIGETRRPLEILFEQRYSPFPTDSLTRPSALAGGPFSTARSMERQQLSLKITSGAITS